MAVPDEFTGTEHIRRQIMQNVIKYFFAFIHINLSYDFIITLKNFEAGFPHSKNNLHKLI